MRFLSLQSNREKGKRLARSVQIVCNTIGDVQSPFSSFCFSFPPREIMTGTYRRSVSTRIVLQLLFTRSINLWSRTPCNAFHTRSTHSFTALRGIQSAKKWNKFSARSLCSKNREINVVNQLAVSREQQSAIWNNCDVVKHSVSKPSTEFLQETFTNYENFRVSRLNQNLRLSQQYICIEIIF